MYKPTIGLEIHAELKTRSKMFCDCRNDPEEKHPNLNVCPICLGHPGTLPVINKKAVEYVLKVGMALGGKPAKKSKFDRKNYFYPDLPKNYQISQYDMPLISGGELRGVRITRVHLEEDAGRLVHEVGSLVDFNRAGVPLMELVTEPDIRSSDEAVLFAKELQLILKYLGASDADMEKGLMRIEANVSVKKEGLNQSRGLVGRTGSINEPVLGTKVEVKNINSFKAVHDAIEYEIKRQVELLEKGEKIKQETRGWDDVKGITKAQRSKEEAHDYRYFPEPDLPQLDLTPSTDGFDLEKLKLEIPELPEEKRRRFEKEYLLSPEQTETLAIEPALADFFEAAVSEAKTFTDDTAITQIAFNYLTSDLRGLIKQNEMAIQDLKFTPEDFAHLAVLAHSKKISSRIAKDLLLKMFESGGDPENIIKEQGMEQISDESAILPVIHKILVENSSAVNDFKKGKVNALKFLIGQAMRELKGRGNPEALKRLIEKEIPR
ncbi:glutaminyl-tRNA synthase (glutamine-hydrolyzing) subunit B [Candidatus Wolfebacteria bacterium RIFCSPLOWO2_01_FULL_45_19]|uniref:Aspartyl/glutamyl-tRNA(Asn/Gln) amidotransferase subunit B n=1 Tax=Candidatus Wolfebacteria bacterium RIFCSPLOWO2_01_FULL_45_19 TaxID=1802557 RepID=A0A1F8DSX4_9BACT|nr:MAG: glutaminyl-tRNA synthase (glutamine-hydrolyzing) subunit B [Candidatus Wolfebacteria bacterium RIFCSPLOWO2_01_FULL_45_19]